MWSRRVRRLASLAAQGEFFTIAKRMRDLLWSTGRSVVLRRDLSKPRPNSRSGPSFVVRRYRPDDAVNLFGHEQFGQYEKYGRWTALGARNCYVAALQDGRAVFLQWLITEDEQQVLREIDMPAASDTVVLDGAYTPPRFRRLGIMPEAMAQIAEKGREFNARWVLVSIGLDNASMIKASRMAGFEPLHTKEIQHRFLRRYVVWNQL
jgi:GNAT superfamily N-acetyltransferase